MDKEALYFFKYAFPCSETLRDLGRLTPEAQDHLKEEFLKGIAPSRHLLEQSFPVAFQRLERLGKSMGKDKWDLEVLQKYWREEHNQVIDHGEGTYARASTTLKDLCRVHRARVVERKTGELLRVQYLLNHERFVFNLLVPGAKVGDVVTIHYGYAIEIL